MKQRFEKLSNGNQTKVYLLLALSQGADLLMLDEPTTALDPVSVDQLLRMLAEAASESGMHRVLFLSSNGGGGADCGIRRRGRKWQAPDGISARRYQE
jgi:ABC-2 type transport system ATP-binding protein